MSDNENNSSGTERSNVLNETSDEDVDDDVVVVDGVTVFIDGVIGFKPLAIYPDRVNVDGTKGDDGRGVGTPVPVDDDDTPGT